MEMEDADKPVREGRISKKRYCVIFVQTLKQWEVTEILQRALPEGGGEVFYPCVEMWWHGLKKTKYKALFPGYVFIRSEMEAVKLHDFIGKNRKNILSFVKELHISETKTDGGDGAEAAIIDLSDDEAAFFDYLLGFEYDDELETRREEAEKEGALYKPSNAHSGQNTGEVAAAGSRRKKKRIPQKGIVQISFGYKEHGRYIVMDGPLKGHEDHIMDYKPKDQKAYLDISIGGHVTKVGLIILGKKVWFPEDGDAPDILTDGTEVDCRELARIMNGGKRAE